LSLLHRGDEHSRRFGEKPRGLEDDFGAGRNAERLDDNIDFGQRPLHGGHLERVAGHFFELRVINRNPSSRPRQRTHRMPRLEGGLHGLKADPSARADDQDYRHGVMLPLGPAWLTVMCDAGSRTARSAGGLKRVSKVVAIARRASYVAAKRVSGVRLGGNWLGLEL
jgi:hypothetical protein